MKHSSIMKQIHIALIITMSSAWAATKNTPDERAVEERLKEAGKTHWVLDMDVDELGSARVVDHRTGEDTYFHIFTSYIDGAHKYRIILFDNEQRYLGYYLSPFEPVDFEEGTVLLDGQDGSSYFHLPLSTKEFPARMRTGMYMTTFVKYENDQTNADSIKRPVENRDSQAEQADNTEPEYRDWTITAEGKEITFNAVFIRRENNMIILKESKQGFVKGFPGHLFSKHDQVYLKDLLEL